MDDERVQKISIKKKTEFIYLLLKKEREKDRSNSKTRKGTIQLNETPTITGFLLILKRTLELLQIVGVCRCRSSLPLLVPRCRCLGTWGAKKK
jgi:hypothetical protein